MRTIQLILAAAFIAATAAAAHAETVNTGAFRTIELARGGTVIVKSGSAQSVNMTEGDFRYTHFSIDRDGKLRIVTSCNSNCPQQYRLRVEVMTPPLAGYAVEQGGTIRAEGSFHAQDNVAAAVRQGGTVDVRAIPGNNVAAAVNQGGHVIVTANKSIAAAVHQGGHVEYWGNPGSITKAIHDGGAINRGDGADRNAHGLSATHGGNSVTVTTVRQDGQHHEVIINGDEHDSYDDDDDSDDDEDDNDDE